jgi:hypothetical protein
MQKRDAEERDLHSQSCDSDSVPQPSDIILFRVFRQNSDNRLTCEVLAS